MFFFLYSSSFSFSPFIGVSQWAEYGINPSHYPRALLEGCQQSIPSSPSSATPSVPDAVDIMAGGFRYAASKKVVGSSTACILSVTSSSPSSSSNPRGPCGTLDAANVGDTGYLILSRSSNPESKSSLHEATNSHYEMCFQSQPQHSKEIFNCPYQLGYVVDTPNRCENPNDASWFEYPVYCEDIIVSGIENNNNNNK